MRIDSERLAIRPIMPEDSRAIFGYRSDKETNKYQSWIPDSLAEVDEFIAKNPNTFNLPESWFQLVMTDKIAKAVIGDIGVHFFGAEHLQVELGCTIKKEFQQQGYAKEGLKTVIAALFRQYHKHRIMASVAPENKASMQRPSVLRSRPLKNYKVSGHVFSDSPRHSSRYPLYPL
ncbi:MULTISPECIES: GNAT family N-acetyltransferase [Sphingobacterium]|uniref:GNAT family N-acetyltransferase n=1 Tax=Sphingobacterium TaxID=28453 RepID=UPI0032E42ED5